MTFKHLLVFGILSLLITKTSWGQVKEGKDERRSIPLIHADFGATLFEGDRSGTSDFGLQTGGGFMLKDKKNFIYDLEFNYQWTDNVENTARLIPNLITSNGLLIDHTGTNAALAISYRSYSFMGHFGRILLHGKKNQNSGIFATVGLGYQYSYYYIKSERNTVPQLVKDYGKAYDKLRGGLALSQSLGYIHFDDDNLLNYIIQFEVKENFAKSLRDYDFNLKMKDNAAYTDIYFGLKVSWMFTFKKKVKDFYYD